MVWGEGLFFPPNSEFSHSADRIICYRSINFWWLFFWWYNKFWQVLGLFLLDVFNSVDLTFLVWATMIFCLFLLSFRMSSVFLFTLFWKKLFVLFFFQDKLQWFYQDKNMALRFYWDCLKFTNKLEKNLFLYDIQHCIRNGICWSIYSSFILYVPV